MTVGRSWRTHAKHTLIGNFLGKEVGVVNSMAAKESITRAVWFDLTAGDGIAPDGEQWSRNCTPGLLAAHAVNLKVPTWIRLYEMKPATYGRLLDNLARQLPAFGYERTSESRWTAIGLHRQSVLLEALYGSGANAEVDGIDASDAVLALNDPNAITEWAMRPSFCAEVIGRGAWCFRTLSTLGCNPAGLKRLPLEERVGWFDLMRAQQDALPAYRDLLLAAIERDDAQWAYLISTAAKWRAGTEKSTEAAFRQCGRTVAMSWYRTDTDKFEATTEALFLTKKERNGEVA